MKQTNPHAECQSKLVEMQRKIDRQRVANRRDRDLLRRALVAGGFMHAGHEDMCPVAPGAKVVDGAVVRGLSKDMADCTCWVRAALDALGMKELGEAIERSALSNSVGEEGSK